MGSSCKPHFNIAHLRQLGMANHHFNSLTDPACKGIPKQINHNDLLAELARLLARQAAAELVAADKPAFPSSPNDYATEDADAASQD